MGMGLEATFTLCFRIAELAFLRDEWNDALNKNIPPKHLIEETATQPKSVQHIQNEMLKSSKNVQVDDEMSNDEG